MKKTNKAKRVLAALAAVTMVASSGASIMASAAKLEMGNLASGGKFYTDYNTLDDAMAAAEALNQEITAEGNVLLKNNGVLPMSTASYVSVFGRADDALIGGYGSVSDSLAQAGFHVNPLLKAHYDADEFKSGATANTGFASGGKNIGTEPINFGARVENSFSLYKDAAIVVLSRNGGEGSDPARVTAEENSDENNVGGWEHQNLAEKDGKQFKHYLQLTDSENELIDYAKSKCDKVIVVLNTSNIMEMYNLQNDERIDGILLAERPGAKGISAIGKILSGEVNPSGKTGDTWYRDFSADPTWMNFGDEGQVGANNYFSYMGNEMKNINGVSYEEGIYIGYKYYETVYGEIKASNLAVKDGQLVAVGTEGAQTGAAAAEAWWNNNVVYAYGYGLSYTTFENQMGDLFVDAGMKTRLGETVNAADFTSSVGHPAKYQKLYVPVTITNTGFKAGKQIAQVYVTAPYTKGGVEKAFVKLVGFAKTKELQPGEKQTVVVEFNVQDMASFDYNDANKNGAKTYELDAGHYEIKLMADSHNEIAQKTFELNGTAVLAADDFSGNKVEATDFSNPASEYYTIIDPDADNGFFTGSQKMTILSRGDIAGTMPQAHEKGEYVATKALLDYMYENTDVVLDKGFQIDNPDAKWYIAPAELEALMADWTQASAEQVKNRENGMCDTLLRDMAGVPLYNADGSVNPAWTAFMNQMSFDEMKKLISQCSQSTAAIPSIAKLAARNIDGPNSTAGMSWQDETTLGCTWNTDLAEKMGIMVGNLYTLKGYTTWYAPAVNQHRSPFGGRNNEYYSSDSIHAGYIAAAATAGCESRGVNTYIKHFALNDQETNRQNISTFADEQNIRENYLQAFQMAVQEGGASGMMCTFSRVGVVSGPSNYVMIQDIARDEWGFEGVFGTDFFSYKVSSFTVGTKGEDNYYSFGTDQGKKSNITTCIDLMIRTGGVHPLGNDNTLSGAWVESLRGGKGGVTVKNGAEGAAVENELQYYYIRLQAMRIAYVYANSVNIDNGLIFGENYTMILDYVDKTRQPQPATIEKTIEAAQVGVSYSVSLAATEHELGEGNVPVYSVSKGELPAGMSIDAKTGALTGMPTEAGVYKFTVRATVDHNYGEANITLNVAESISFLGDTTVKVGEEVAIVVDNEDGTLAYTSKTYKATGLPAGVTIGNDGTISGTPTEAGVYNVVVTITGNKDVYTREFTLTVTTDALTLEQQVAQLIEKVTALETASNASATELAGVKTELAAVKGDIATMNASTDVADLTAKVTALETKVAEIEAAAAATGCNSSVSALGALALIAPVAVAYVALRAKKKED